MVCSAAAELGIRKFKITGGEPLVRLGCPGLIGMIKRLPGVEQVTLTTNGILLEGYLEELLENGLDAVNVSMDTLDEETYRQITRLGEIQSVREGIRRAVEKGMRVKVNSVLQRGVNAHEWEALARLAKEDPVDVRFIEMMPIGHGEKEKGVKGNEIISKLRKKYPDIKRVIRDRTRGKMSKTEVQDGIRHMIRDAIGQKPQMHCFDTEEGITKERQMVQIGG